MREPDAWCAYPESLEKLAAHEALKTIPFVADRGRDPDQVFDDLACGFIIEAWHNVVNGHADWWCNHRKACRGKRYDGGDTPEGWDVKSIKPDHACVCVAHESAEKYLVYELDRENRRIRYRGSFVKSDIHNVMLPNGKWVRGVYVEELQ